MLLKTKTPKTNFIFSWMIWIILYGVRSNYIYAFVKEIYSVFLRIYKWGYLRGANREWPKEREGRGSFSEKVRSHYEWYEFLSCIVTVSRRTVSYRGASRGGAIRIWSHLRLKFKEQKLPEMADLLRIIVANISWKLNLPDF